MMQVYVKKKSDTKCSTNHSVLYSCLRQSFWWSRRALIAEVASFGAVVAVVAATAVAAAVSA